MNLCKYGGQQLIFKIIFNSKVQVFQNKNQISYLILFIFVFKNAFSWFWFGFQIQQKIHSKINVICATTNMAYHSTLTTMAIFKLFIEIFKFSKNILFKEQNFAKENIKYIGTC